MNSPTPRRDMVQYGQAPGGSHISSDHVGSI